MHSRLPLQSVALGDKGKHVILYEDGDSAWSSGLPDGLYTVLRMSKNNGEKMLAVAMGRNQGSDSYSTAADPGKVWFLRHDTASNLGGGCEKGLRDCWWNGDRDDSVVNVAFAPSCGWYAYRRGAGLSTAACHTPGITS